MAEDKEKTVQKTYRLPAGDVELVELLARKRILGSNPSAVVRALLSGALRQLVENDYVKKYGETIQRLKDGSPE